MVEPQYVIVQLDESPPRRRYCSLVHDKILFHPNSRSADAKKPPVDSLVVRGAAFFRANEIVEVKSQGRGSCLHFDATDTASAWEQALIVAANSPEPVAAPATEDEDEEPRAFRPSAMETVEVLDLVGARRQRADSAARFKEEDSKRNEDERTTQQMFWDAAQQGDLADLEELLGGEPAPELNGADVMGHTALHQAAAHGHADLVARLLTEPAIALELRTVSGYTACLLGCDRGHPEVVQVRAPLIASLIAC